MGAHPHGQSSVRQPVVAGTFYPSDPEQLTAQIDHVLARADPRPAHAPPAKAIVAPHAGYLYSGPIAATAYRAIEGRSDDVERVVLLGPAHRVPLEGMAIPSVDAFRTPLGDVPIDDVARRQIASLPGVVTDDRPHRDEHSLEVHLPFLQRVLVGPWELVPIVVGRAAPIEVADVLATLWGGSETLVVVSSDLSHYHDYGTAVALDQRTAAAIVGCEVDAITPQDACGAHPVRGLLELCRRAGLDVELLDLRNSGDTGGERTSVVGYGAFALS
jgi:AmmeMemoRadiSam system protein B